MDPKTVAVAGMSLTSVTVIKQRGLYFHSELKALHYGCLLCITSSIASNTRCGRLRRAIASRPTPATESGWGWSASRRTATWSHRVPMTRPSESGRYKPKIARYVKLWIFCIRFYLLNSLQCTVFYFLYWEFYTVRHGWSNFWALRYLF